MGRKNSDLQSTQDEFESSLARKFLGSECEGCWEILEPAFDRVQIRQGERLINQGESGDTVFIVIEGHLRVVDEQNDRVLDDKEPGDGVGEISLLTGERRTASVDAETDSKLLSLSRQKLHEIRERHPEAGQVLMEALIERIHKSRLNHVLVLSEVFKGFSEELLREMQGELELITIPSGAIIMEVGDEPDALYMVIGGRLRVVSPRVEGEKRYQVDIRRGQSVGETGLITGEKRNATVFALRDTLLARLSRASFKKLLQKYPEEMLSQFATPILDRLRHQLSVGFVKTSAVTTITIIPVDREVPLAEFAAGLTEGLSQLGSIMLLDSEQCAVQLGTANIAYLADDDPVNDRFVFWLNQQEANHDFVVYQADYELSRWTERCIRQADMVLILGNADSSPAPCVIESRLHREEVIQATIQCLVLIHNEGTVLPQGTDQWLSPRKLRSHYHMRRGNTADFRRISRLITGQGNGLVLSGGGARALAHIGVIQALEERGIPIDAIGAVSGGAIVAGLWAMGLETREIIRRCIQANDRIDYTFPFHALTSGRNWTNSMRLLFGELLIEDLWRRFFCVSASLSKAALVTHQAGSLAHAVRASTAIPGILPPVYHQGDILVDGGLLNNLPADLMRAHPDIGTVIAVDVGMGDSSKEVSPFDYHVSGWKSLWGRLAPWGADPAMPPISETLLRSISISSASAAQITRRVVDLYLNPPVESFGLMDFNKIEELAGIGYDYAVKEIAAWKRGNLDA